MRFRFRLAGLLLAALLLAAPRVASAAEVPTWDATPGKVVFIIQTHGGVVSPLQELTALPDFVLYGDGMAIWSRYDKRQELREVMTAQLTEDEVRQELSFVLGKGYADWLDRYDDANLPNLPTTTFNLNLQGRSLKRLVYGLQYALKRSAVPAGFGEIFERYSQFSHAGQKPYRFNRLMLYARQMGRVEAKRGYRSLSWNVKHVKLADFARESETEYGQMEVSGKDADHVVGRLKKWTLFSTDLSIFFFNEKKKDYQVGYRPLLPGE